MGRYLCAGQASSPASDALIALMAPDVVRAADPAVLPEDGAVEVVGNRAVAEETRYFADRIHASIAMLVNGTAAAVIAPGGHPLAAITFTFEDETFTVTPAEVGYAIDLDASVELALQRGRTGLPGDVLVASVTDVGHTAMFGYSSAVVTDIGGAASHAAIVAREFGIPCVVDTKHATTSLRDGQLVRVDGVTGTVTLLAEADAPASAGEETAVG
jgi:phosphohistidine swiveling domain-containing protein